MTVLLRTATVLLALLLPLTGVAQTSTLIGTVVDAQTGEPLPDVTVTATSPSLEEPRTVFTDAWGHYRIAGLSPDFYGLLFEKQDYQSYMRPDILLRPNRTVRLNMSLTYAYVRQDVSHADRYPGAPLKFTDSTTGAEPWAQGESLASHRPSERAGAVRVADDLASWVPGVAVGLEGFSVHDATPYENAYLVGGLSTRDAATGLNALPISPELSAEPRVLTAGLMPEHGRATGGILELHTRNGGDDGLRGSVFAHWLPGLLEGGREPVGDGSAPRHLGDLGATVSGSLLRDRVLFFAGVTPALGRVEHTGPSGTSFSDSRGLQALGNLVYLLTPSHHVQLSVLTAPQSLREEGATLERSTHRVALHQSREFRDGELKLDVRAGWLGQRDAWELPPGAPTGEDGVLLERSLDQYQARVQVAWKPYFHYMGEHFVRAGLDVEHFVHARTRAWTDDTGEQRTQQSHTPGTVLGGYVQESWTVGGWVTLHGGLRYDVQRLSTGEAESSGVTVPLLSPRVGMLVDLWNLEGAKLFVHYARYPGLVPLGLLDRATVEERVPVQGPSLIDPELEAMASREVVAGAAFHVDSDFLALLSATYTHRALDSGLASLRTDSQGSYVLVNPGSGLGAGLPKAARTYDAVTLELHRAFDDDWMGHLSYTRSWLRGNHAGPWEGVTSASGPLPGDRPHVLRLYGARELKFSNALSLSGGLSYLGGSGTPVADGGSRTPWLHTVDARLILHWWPLNKHRVSFSLDAFNVLNFQAATRLEAGDSGLVPVRYQPPRQLRLGIRYMNF